MQRREFLGALGGAAATNAWPIAAHAQQAMPVIGFLDARSNSGVGERMRALHQGLKETSHVEGDNLTIVYRWADNRPERLPELAADLVRRNVSVIVTAGGNITAQVVKAATSSVPVVFLVATDPVQLGLVTSLARPTGNLTGINMILLELEQKRLGLLLELLPQAKRIAVLVSTGEQQNAETTIRDVGVAARTAGLQVQILKVSTIREIDTAFEQIARERADALFVGSSAFMNARRVQLVQLAAAHKIPAIYALRESAEAGGLISYGADILVAYRQLGVYAGRILKGVKPADLPVVQAAKFELIINLATARAQGIAIPPTLLARADEVIE